MIINGRKVDAPKVLTVYVPREGFDLCFKFQAVLNDDEFEKINPEPMPKKAKRPDGTEFFLIEDETYKQELIRYGDQRKDWMFLKSISATDGLKWETVRMEDPGTYKNWRTEMEAAGFSIAEVNVIYSKFAEANMLTESMIEQARQRFLSRSEQSLKPAEQ